MNRRISHKFLLLAGISTILLTSSCRRSAPAQQSVPPPTISQEISITPTSPVPPEEAESVLVTPAASSPGGELLPLEALNGLPFDRFLEDSFKLILLRDPEWITAEGLSAALGSGNSQLTDISAAYQEQNLEIYRAIQSLLASYDRSSLAAEQQVSYAAYQWYLDDLLLQGEYRLYNYPLNPIITGIQYQLQYLFTDLHPLLTLQDAQDYLARLSQVEVKIAQLIETLQASQQQGVFPPQVAIQASLGDIQEVATSSPEATPFYTTLQDKLPGIAGLSEAQRKHLLDEARLVIGSSVIPAYKSLADYLAGMKTIPTGKGGVWQHPAGADYYQAALHHHTTTDLTADEIHQLGLDALVEIQAEMRQRFDQLGYPADESLEQLFQRVARDSGFVQGDAILPGYQTLINTAGANLESAFDQMPAAQLEVRQGPGSTAFYVSPAVNGSRPGVFYAPVYGAEPRFKMPTLAYHEGVPGHHFQISLMQELDLPLLHSLAGFTAYLEGWALYAERLAQELGWYAADPYGDLGRLQMEAFRAARLVVDTGLHAEGWTFDQALDFLVENTGLERNFLENEVVRYLVWPGQATSYSLGYFKILELRQRAMDVLGDDFDLKEFHRIILGSGSLPLPVLERVVQDYITLASLEQVSDYPLYLMRYQGDYGFDEFLQSGVQPLGMRPAASPGLESLPASQPAWACTGFAALNPSGEIVVGRNFDWLEHPAMLLFTDPADGYAAVSMVDLHYLGVQGEIDETERQNLLRAPYLPFDGMNDRGLAVTMMAVPEADSGFDPQRVTLSGLNLIRLLLDQAASVGEALELMGAYNIDFGGGPLLHYFVADSAGSSAVVEYVDGEMKAIQNQAGWQVATNFLLFRGSSPRVRNRAAGAITRLTPALEGTGGAAQPGGCNGPVKERLRSPANTPPAGRW